MEVLLTLKGNYLKHFIQCVEITAKGNKQNYIEEGLLKAGSFGCVWGGVIEI